jgi:hypothetical protein
VSFTSTFPTNIPKFSYAVAPTIVSSIDSAIGVDSISSIFRQLFDYVYGFELGFVKPLSTDLGVGMDLSRLSVRAGDIGSGVERVSYRSVVLFDYGKGSELVVKRFIQLFDLAKTLEVLIPSMHTTLSSALGDVSSCISAVFSMYSEVDYGKEVKASHFTTVSDCALKVASTVGRLLQSLELRGIKFPVDTYSKLAECWRLSATYPRLRSGSIIEPEHENMLIDIVTCLDSLYSLLKHLLAAGLVDRGSGVDYLRTLDLTPVADRLIYVNTPIPHYTSQLSPPGGYVLTKPPVTFKTAYVGSLWTTAWSLSLYVKNITAGYTIKWSDKRETTPCAKVYVYSDGWVIAWIEDMCWGIPDWDYNDMAVGVRAEVLDEVTYIHTISLDQDHMDTDQPCIDVQGSTYCNGNIGSYSGPVRIVWETWIKVI